MNPKPQIQNPSPKTCAMAMMLTLDAEMAPNMRPAVPTILDMPCPITLSMLMSLIT